MPQRHKVVIVDHVDIDNTAAVQAAFHRLLGLEPCAVIVTGRFAHPDRGALIDEHDPAYSAEVRALNARRMKAFLLEAGIDVPVFEGLTPPATLVPHRVHIDEKLFGLYPDVALDGDFNAAIEFLCGLIGQIDFVVGGPLTELAALMREPRLAGRLGTVTCQLGLFGSIDTMAGGGATFNSGCDPQATREVLFYWPEAVYLMPTDVTKRDAVGFDDPEAFRAFGISEGLVRLYEIFYDVALKPRGERIFPHDVHAVFLMAQLFAQLGRQLYTWEEVRIQSVDDRGRIDAAFGETMPDAGRFIVRDVDAAFFMELLGITLK